jgi:hypothetical protein
MEAIHAVLGAVALMIVTVGLILGLTIVVLIEARWALRLFVDLYRRWRTTIRQLKDEGLP